MGLEYWLEKSREAGKVAKELLQQKQALEFRLSYSKGELEATELNLTKVKSQATDFMALQGEIIENLEAQVTETKVQVKAAERSLATFTTGTANWEKRIQRTKKESDEVDGLYSKVTQERNALKTELAIITKECASLSTVLKMDGLCDLCRQSIDEQHKHTLIPELDMKELAKISIEDEMTVLNNSLKTLEQTKHTLTRNHNALVRDYQAHTEKMMEIKGQLVITNDRLTNFIVRFNEEKIRQNPFGGMVKVLSKTMAELQQGMATLTAELAVINEDHAAVDFWVAGFKRVRLHVVETTLRQLEIEINNNLTSLGLVDWLVKFDIERETKAGGIAKGFLVFIHAPNKAEPVRWEAFGGGATQRLRLAGNLGVANLIMERAGLVSQVEFYDEFSQHMSAIGIEDTLELLHARAHDLERKIWIVDHHSLDFGGFTGVLKAVKTGKGSKLQWVNHPKN